MVHVVGASSLPKTLKSLKYQNRRFYLPVVTEIPGLSLKQQSNRKSDDYFKSLQNLLTGKLARCENTVIWHDIINNTLSEHPFKKTPAVSSQALVETLKTIRYMVSAIVYCQRVGIPDAYHDIKKARIPVICVKKNLVSKRKQKDKVFGFKYSAIHQNSLLEPKSLKIVLKNAADIKNIKRNTRTKNKRVSQKKEERDNEQGPNRLVVERLVVGFSDTVWASEIHFLMACRVRKLSLVHVGEKVKISESEKVTPCYKTASRSSASPRNALAMSALNFEKLTAAILLSLEANDQKVLSKTSMISLLKCILAMRQTTALSTKS